MGKVHAEIDASLRSFIEAQHVFFVGTAPLDTSGHVNVSPKGLDTLRVIGPQTVAYLDYVGSGAETIAHLRENGRIVIMLCAFEGPPKILRLHGMGKAFEPQDSGMGNCGDSSRSSRPVGRLSASQSIGFQILVATACRVTHTKANGLSFRIGLNGKARKAWPITKRKRTERASITSRLFIGLSRSRRKRTGHALASTLFKEGSCTSPNSTTS
jgi:hypothetical protein